MADPCGTLIRTAWQTDVAFMYLQDADRHSRHDARHLAILLLRDELLTASSNFVWLAVSETFEKSTAINTVRVRVFCWLNPVANLRTSGKRAELSKRCRR